MVIQLDSRAERIIEEQLHTGRFHSPEQVVACALEAMADHAPPLDRLSPTEAVDGLFDFREKHRLSLGRGLSLTDLIRESRKLD